MIAMYLQNTIILSSFNGYLQLVCTLLIFLVVLIVTAFVTRYVGNFQKNLGQGQNIKVIDTSRIAPNKFLQIVKVGDRYFCIGVTQDHISLISEIDENSIKIKKDSTNASFADFLKNFTDQKNSSSDEMPIDGKDTKNESAFSQEDDNL